VSHQSYPIAKLGIGSWTSKGDCSPKPSYVKSRHQKSRNPKRIVSCPSQRISGRRSKCHHFSISEFRILEVLLMEGRDTPWRKSRNLEKITANHSFGHVVEIEETVGISATGVSSGQRIWSRKSRNHEMTRTIHLEGTRGNNLGPRGKSCKRGPSAFRSLRFQKIWDKSYKLAK
jgi:hypothetical protein